MEFNFLNFELLDNSVDNFGKEKSTKGTRKRNWPFR